MAKLQVRNFPDDIFSYIEQAAAEGDRSIEGELRHTLRQVYTPSQPTEPELSQLEAWTQETAARLTRFVSQLQQDGYFKRGEPGDTTHIARLAGDLSPVSLLRCMDGDEALSFDLADRLARRFDGSAHWLMSGNGVPFTAVNLTSSRWKEFFSEPTRQDLFHLIRLSTPRRTGTLLCIRHNTAENSYRAGFVTEQFFLNDGMGGGGSSNLYRFVEYLKKNSRSVCSVGHELKLDEEDEHGYHHPLFYLNHSRITESGWIYNMMTGERPGAWLSGFDYYLKQLADIPFESELAAPVAQEAEHG